jgi:maltose O-acetyltransferase
MYRGSLYPRGAPAPAEWNVGDRLFINFNCVILDCNRVTIGNDVFIGPGVHIYTADHPVDPQERVLGLELARPVTMGDKVWLGGGAIICPGVTIGEGSTIGAGSVVVHDIPPYVVAVGNPCRVVRHLR